MKQSSHLQFHFKIPHEVPKRSKLYPQNDKKINYLTNPSKTHLGLVLKLLTGGLVLLRHGGLAPHGEPVPPPLAPLRPPQPCGGGEALPVAPYLRRQKSASEKRSPREGGRRKERGERGRGHGSARHRSHC